jgi:hypothetical protein
MNNPIRIFFIGVLCSAIVVALAGCSTKNDSVAQAEKMDAGKPSIEQVKAIAEEAYIYGFPMIAAYKAMYEFNVDTSSSQYQTT